MAAFFAFQPTGPTMLVTSVAAQIGQGMRVSNSYRVRNMAGVTQYFTTGKDNTVTSVGAPVAGTPSANTIGMNANEVKTFTGLGDWMIASSATGFEVTPGDGI